VASQPPTAPPDDGAESPTGPLITNLTDALTDPNTPPSMPRLQGIIAAETPATRSAVFHNQGFRASSVWQETSASRVQIQAAVAPLAPLAHLTGSAAERRTQFVSHGLQQWPTAARGLSTPLRARPTAQTRDHVDAPPQPTSPHHTRHH